MQPGGGSDCQFFTPYFTVAKNTCLWSGDVSYKTRFFASVLFEALIFVNFALKLKGSIVIKKAEFYFGVSSRQHISANKNCYPLKSQAYHNGLGHGRYEQVKADLQIQARGEKICHIMCMPGEHMIILFSTLCYCGLLILSIISLFFSHCGCMSVNLSAK